MSIEVGSRLQHYEVLAPLGAGAMGEVWRARDTKLGRDVAIKVLPEHFAKDAERLARFGREATSLAALNHPNVAQIFGVDEAGDAAFLVLELVPGESLEERLKRGALPIDEAIDVARQIAEGLEAAHDAGVIHRDLKPANIRVTPDGKVKVLDFGLAKPIRGDGDGASTTDSALSTEAGRLLGTPTYMAPEQARGRPIDRRVDVWAFGCVLYECLTAKRAFAGETLSDVLASVLEKEPDWSRLPAATPPRLRELLERCFEKDPRARLRDIGEARLVLQSPGAIANAGAPARSARLPWTLCVLLAGAALYVARLHFAGASSSTARPAAGLHFTRLTDLPGPELNPDLSPDGSTLLFVGSAAGNRDVCSLRVGGSRIVNLTADCTADDSAPRFSRDGQSIVFRSERDGGGLFVMGATGENVRRVTDAGFDPCWSPDGRQIACSEEPVDNPCQRVGISPLWVIDLDTGARRRLSDGDAVQPDWSPDGRWIACWSNPTGQRDLVLIPAQGGPPVALTNDAATDWSPAWSPDGRRLFFASDRGGSMNLWSLAIDPASGKPDGEPRAETNGVRDLGYARLAADGRRMTCLAHERATDFFVYRLDADARTVELVKELPRQPLSLDSISADGTWLFGATTGAREDIVQLRSDGGELRRLTSDLVRDRSAFVSPDGRSILFKSMRSGRWEPWLVRVDGAGLTQLGDLENSDVMGWDRDDHRAWAYEIRDGACFQVPLDPKAITQTKDPGESRLPPELTLISCFAPGGRPHTLLAQLPSADTRRDKIGIYDLRTQTFEPFAVECSGSINYVFGGMLPDGRRAVVLTRTGAVIYDVEARTARPLAGVVACDGLLLSADGRTLVAERAVYDGDVWLGEYK